MHCHPLPSVHVFVNEMLVEEIHLKLSFRFEKGFFYAFPSLFIAPSHKSKSQGKVDHDEYSYCKEMGHWKANYPKLLKP